MLQILFTCSSIPAASPSQTVSVSHKVHGAHSYPTSALFSPLQRLQFTLSSG